MKYKVKVKRQTGGLAGMPDLSFMTSSLATSLMPTPETKGERMGQGIGSGVGAVGDMALNMLVPGLGSLGIGKAGLGAAGQAVGSLFKPDTEDSDNRKALNNLTRTKSNDVTNAYGTAIYRNGGSTHSYNTFPIEFPVYQKGGSPAPTYSWSAGSQAPTPKYKVKENKDYVRNAPARINTYGETITPYMDYLSRNENSNAENFFEIIDPTGVSSHDDLAKARREGTDTPLDYISVIPLIGKVSKVLKALDMASTMKDAGQFVQEGLDKEQPKENGVAQKQVGGSAEPDYEAEHNEVVIKKHPGEPIKMHGAGKLEDESSYAGTIKGDHHGEDTDQDGQEGEAMSGGDYILSDILTLDYKPVGKKNGKSAAATARPLVKLIEEAENTTDIYKKNTLKNHVQQLDNMKNTFDYHKQQDGLLEQVVRNLGVTDDKEIIKHKSNLRKGIDNGEITVNDLKAAVKEMASQMSPADYNPTY